MSADKRVTADEALIVVRRADVGIPPKLVRPKLDPRLPSLRKPLVPKLLHPHLHPLWPEYNTRSLHSKRLKLILINTQIAIPADHLKQRDFELVEGELLPDAGLRTVAEGLERERRRPGVICTTDGVPAARVEFDSVLAPDQRVHVCHCWDYLEYRALWDVGAADLYVANGLPRGPDSWERLSVSCRQDRE